MFEQIISRENLQIAYEASRVGKMKVREQAVEFYNNETVNLNNLRRSLSDMSYEVGPYNKFYVLEPKRRLVHAPSYNDKIVQYMLHQILLPYSYLNSLLILMLVFQSAVMIMQY